MEKEQVFYKTAQVFYTVRTDNAERLIQILPTATYQFEKQEGNTYCYILGSLFYFEQGLPIKGVEGYLKDRFMQYLEARHFSFEADDIQVEVKCYPQPKWCSTEKLNLWNYLNNLPEQYLNL